MCSCLFSSSARDSGNSVTSTHSLFRSGSAGCSKAGRRRIKTKGRAIVLVSYKATQSDLRNPQKKATTVVSHYKKRTQNDRNIRKRQSSDGGDLQSEPVGP